MKVKIDKQAINKSYDQLVREKAESIGAGQQEDRKSPEAEMDKLIKREEKFEGTDTEYFKSIYKSDEMRNLELNGSHSPKNDKPTAEQPAVEEDSAVKATAK